MPAKLDQHFLVDDVAADRIITAAEVRADEDIVEIGPGEGVLTRRLLSAGARVTAVEYDPKLVAFLKRECAGEALTLIHSDWMELDLDALPRPAKIVSNLPYSVGTAILQRLLDWPAWVHAVLMFQKEVADRILAEPKTKPYGVLSLSVRIKAEAWRVFDLPPESFNPPPKVDSTVVAFQRLQRLRLPEDLSEKQFFGVVKAAFSQKRKMAAKLLAGAYGRERADVEKTFRKCGLRIDARAETIPLAAFIKIAQWLIHR